MKPLDEALHALLASAHVLTGTESVATAEADGRVLAHDLVSALQVPQHDNSAMDGFAVRSEDVDVPGQILVLSHRIAAGRYVEAPQALHPHTAARIFTGAPLPVGADAVVMQEDCVQLPESEPHALTHVRVNMVPVPGQHVRRSGEDVARGDVVLPRGKRLDPVALGLAASIGMAQVPVVRRPRVALFSTGDELIMPGERLPEQMPMGAVYNSNRFFLQALLRRLGCEVTDLGIVPDQRSATERALLEASHQYDVLLTSGGVSVGEEDHLRPAVHAIGSLEQWQIAIKPGKPFAHGRIGAAHFLGLPGNPVSSLVTFLVLVRPFLLKLQGVSDVAMKTVALPAHFDWPRSEKRREFLRVRRNPQGGLDLFANQGAGVLTSAVWGDGLVDNPAHTPIAHGDRVHFASFAELLA